MTGNAEEIIKWLFTQDREKQFDISEHKEKRSLNANAYAWSLIGKIADAMRITKDEAYFKALKDWGQSEIVSVLSSINVSGYFKYFEAIGTGTIVDKKTGKVKEFTHYKVYKGSSEYDTREMSILIDGLIQDAKELNIDTLPPNEVQRLKEMWKQ